MSNDEQQIDTPIPEAESPMEEWEIYFEDKIKKTGKCCLYKDVEKCRQDHKRINEEKTRLKNEFKLNMELITNKVKGKMRKAQTRNKEIKERLYKITICDEHWHTNGGIH
jgi:hypothetical protein